MASPLCSAVGLVVTKRVVGPANPRGTASMTGGAVWSSMEEAVTCHLYPTALLRSLTPPPAPRAQEVTRGAFWWLFFLEGSLFRVFCLGLFFCFFFFSLLFFTFRSSRSSV